MHIELVEVDFKSSLNSERAFFISITFHFHKILFLNDSNCDILKIKEISILCRQKNKNATSFENVLVAIFFSLKYLGDMSIF